MHEPDLQIIWSRWRGLCMSLFTCISHSLASLTDFISCMQALENLLGWLSTIIHVGFCWSLQAISQVQKGPPLHPQTSLSYVFKLLYKLYKMFWLRSWCQPFRYQSKLLNHWICHSCKEVGIRGSATSRHSVHCWQLIFHCCHQCCVSHNWRSVTTVCHRIQAFHRINICQSIS